MSKKGSRQIDGYVDFVVPPLEGFWWQDGVEGADYTRKETFSWIAVIRLPDFVSREAMHAHARECGYSIDLTQERRHHEIYLSDARKVAPGKLKTIIRHPIKASEEKK